MPIIPGISSTAIAPNTPPLCHIAMRPSVGMLMCRGCMRWYLKFSTSFMRDITGDIVTGVSMYSGLSVMPGSSRESMSGSRESVTSVCAVAVSDDSTQRADKMTLRSFIKVMR